MSVLTDIIKAEIAGSGAIPFARFMELALYCPDYGYYETENVTVGRHGDFYTSVSVGSLLGELLASQFASWLEELPPGKLQIVEAAAHDGKLALDILRWLERNRPSVFERIEYVILEPSARRRAWQEKTLAEFSGAVHWLSVEKLDSTETICGVIFANELLDAMPVHRLGWDAQRRAWFEWGVAWEVEKFVWVKIGKSVETANLNLLPIELLAVLPNGFTTEICPAAQEWWCSAARALKGGRLMTLDYGFQNEAGLSPNHPNGTLRAYHRHKVSDDVLTRPGEQDITAHVEFHSIQSAGESAGLKTETFVSQSSFLTRIASEMMKAEAHSQMWTPQKSRELQTLIHPEHLGWAFNVLLQMR